MLLGNRPIYKGVELKKFGRNLRTLELYLLTKAEPGNITYRVQSTQVQGGWLTVAQSKGPSKLCSEVFSVEPRCKNGANLLSYVGTAWSDFPDEECGSASEPYRKKLLVKVEEGMFRISHHGRLGL